MSGASRRGEAGVQAGGPDMEPEQRDTGEGDPDRNAEPGDPGQAAGAVIGLYQRHAAAFLAARTTRLVEKAWLDRFLDIAGRGAAILDVGCGSGVPIAAYMAGRGARVTGVDSSPALLAAFAGNVPGATAILSDMRSIRLEQRFAGVLAWDSLFHLTRDDQRAMLARLAAHAAPGAALMFNSGPADGIAIGAFEGEPLFHASLDPGAYRALLASHGFSVIAHRADDADCGGRTVWLFGREG